MKKVVSYHLFEEKASRTEIAVTPIAGCEATSARP